MSRRKKPKAEPVKLAKVIPFRDDFRSNLAGELGEIETAAFKDWEQVSELSKVTKANDSKETIELFHRAVERALESIFRAKVQLERQFGRAVAANSTAVEILHRYSVRIEALIKWNDWCEDKMERFAPDATVYNLAEFRRFRNRVIGQVSP